MTTKASRFKKIMIQIEKKCGYKDINIHKEKHLSISQKRPEGNFYPFFSVSHSKEIVTYPYTRAPEM